MRLLHISDALLGNRNYCREVREATGVDLLALDRLVGLELAARCAEDHGVDTVLVAGGLIDGKHDSLAEHRGDVDAWLTRLHAAGIERVLYDPDGSLTALDGAATVLGPSGVVEVGPATVAGIEAPTSPRPIGECPTPPRVVVGYGAIDGIPGWSSFPPSLDDETLASLVDDASYVALGGLHDACLVDRGAAYSGAPANVFAGHQGCPGGIVVEIGDATGELLRMTHVEWAGRPRACVKIDAGGMSVDELAHVMGGHLDRVCHAVDQAAMPDDPDGRIAEIFSPARDVNGIPWLIRPMVEVTVLGPEVDFHEVVMARPSIEAAIDHGEQLLTSIRWCASEERPPKWLEAPRRRADGSSTEKS